MSTLLETMRRYDAIKRERVPMACRDADVTGAVRRGESGEMHDALAVLWVDSGVSVPELEEAVSHAVSSAVADLADAGMLTAENVMIVTMVAQTMWMDGLGVGLRHAP